MIKNKKIELLAPAGNIAKAEYALTFGADALYLGIPDFSLRVRINEITKSDINKIIKCARAQNKKIYITLNIYARNKHIKKIREHLKQLNKIKPDGIIISDPGILELIKKYCPKIPVHLSVQANCTNWQAAKFWLRQGVKRIILARELSLLEITKIHKKVPKMELECFVHGAICMSYSGRCLLSSYLTGRDANLGDCAQPCRWQYKYFLEEQQRKNEFFPIEEDKNGSYILNSKDLCLIKYLDDLKKAGVSSFKIEGRAKSVFYIAMVCKIYREAMDLKKTAGKKEKLNKLYAELQTLTHRDYTDGFLLGNEAVKQKYDAAHKISDYQFVGEVVEKTKNGIYMKIHNAIFAKDTIEFIQPNIKNLKLKLNTFFDQEGKEIVEAHGGQGKTVFIKTKKDIEKMSVARKKITA
ncbi:MAG: U32 family peptidase C-terminal domain-containing protein [Patescibacteria group bacterium]|nr:U32 family peptidase C-terminal domain-containing protein [Patescibacteria group bacterium]